MKETLIKAMTQVLLYMGCGFAVSHALRSTFNFLSRVQPDMSFPTVIEMSMGPIAWIIIAGAVSYFAIKDFRKRIFGSKSPIDNTAQELDERGK